jgi:hypothetical protein
MLVSPNIVHTAKHTVNAQVVASRTEIFPGFDILTSDPQAVSHYMDGTPLFGVKQNAPSEGFSAGHRAKESIPPSKSHSVTLAAPSSIR